MSRPNASKRRKHARKRFRMEKVKRKKDMQGNPDARKMCTRKQRFRTELDARLKAMDIEGRRSVRLGTYRCPICGGWHLTSHIDAE